MDEQKGYEQVERNYDDGRLRLGRVSDSTPQRDTKLPLMAQDKNLAGLGVAIEDLERRLDAILTPVTADRVDDNAKMAERPPASPLAHQLDDNNQTISLLTRRIRSITERVEC